MYDGVSGVDSGGAVAASTPCSVSYIGDKVMSTKRTVESLFNIPKFDPKHTVFHLFVYVLVSSHVYRGQVIQSARP
jgi:hypothetical protein